MSRTNPSPYHDENGKFKPGHKAAQGHRRKKLTRELFEFMDEGQFTLEAGHYLVELMENDKAPTKERRAAAEFIIKQFTQSADKLTDVDLVEQASMSKADIIKGLLGGNITEE